MENLNEQEQIKDPNQLDLFEGVLLTPEQEKMKADYVERCKSSTNLAESTNKYHVKLLIENGFIENVDFVNTFKREIVTREVTLGHSYNNTNFNIELTFESSSGDIRLKGLNHHKGEIQERTFLIDFNKDKVQCGSIQGQFRYIKPSTLLEKLHQHNELQKIYCENYIERNNVKQYTIEKYQKLYPNATITVVQDHTRSMGTFELIQVKFPSGSYVQFYVPRDIDREQVYKKHDAEFVSLTTEKILEKFNKQEALK